MAQAPRALSPGAERDPGARAVGPSARRRTPPRGGALGARRGAGSPSHGEPSRLALSPSPVPDERGARGRAAPGGALNLNLNFERTEVRAVMKPLQGEAQVGRARTLLLPLRAVFVRRTKAPGAVPRARGARAAAAAGALRAGGRVCRWTGSLSCRSGGRPPPSPRTNWTRLILPPVLSGHVSSFRPASGTTWARSTRR